MYVKKAHRLSGIDYRLHKDENGKYIINPYQTISTWLHSPKNIRKPLAY